MDRYERDVLGAQGAARYARPTRTVSSRSLQPDSGVPAASAYMTPVEPPPPPVPVAIPDNRTLFGEMIRGFIDGLTDFVFGRRGPL
ncbi:hypothetical protein ACIBCD_26990 [Nocardia brasiliensis]|uniref:hypothetical protein n=1 Tax=Nocardia brasiliensis TaxID=37326 RepID=UPI0037B46593